MNLMKRYAFVAFFLICSTTLLGQTTFGIRGGVNGSMFVGDDTDIFNEIDELGEEVEAEYKIAYHGGVYARVPISNSVYFRPELLYSLKGTTTRDVFFTYFDATYHNNFPYIDLPLLVEITPVEAFSIFIGPQVSYLISAKRRLENTETNYEDSFDLRRVNVGGAAGLGINFPGGFNLGIRGDYLLLSPFQDIEFLDETITIDVRHITLQFTLGYTFNALDSYGRNYRKGRRSYR